MYLREMGSVELLSREGEIAIAKRIEAGRDAMIRGFCESPLTFEAIMVWRDELREQKILLRDIIDLEATYGAEMGITPPSAPGVNADGLVDPEASENRNRRTRAQEGREGRRPARNALSNVPPAASGDGDGEEKEPGEGGGRSRRDGEFDDEQAISMSAMEAELKEGVMSTLDNIAEAFGQFRKLQEKRIELRLQGKSLPGAKNEAYEPRRTRSSKS
jgi:RNA polymerase primary sigma factor